MFHSISLAGVAPRPYAAHNELSVASSTNDLLTVSGIEHMPRDARWRLIDVIEQRIDKVQWHQQLTSPDTAAYRFLGAQLQALRLKRFAIWNSFYPKFIRAIRVGVA